MQTFLPFRDYHKIGPALDDTRLGNQVYREGKTLAGGGWPHHPASKMWRGHEHELCTYLLAIVDEMDVREVYDAKLDRVRPKYKPDVVPRWRDYFTSLRETLPDTGKPDWMLDDRMDKVIETHRAALKFKSPEWVRPFGWKVKPDVPDPGTGKHNYFWPVR